MTLTPLANNLWLVSPAPAPAGVGQMVASLDASVEVPAGYTLRVYAGPRQGGLSADNHTRAIAPGETWTTGTFRLPAGTRVHASLWYRADATGAYTRASNEKTFVIPSVPPRETPGLPPAARLPVMVAAPVLSGTGKIGTPVTVDPGKWAAPAPALALQWRRDGTAIPSATAARYTPVAADDRTALTCAVTATNAAGSVERVTPALRITHVAPAVVAELPDEVFDAGTGPQEVETAAAFRGQALRFAAAGAGATVAAATGVVTIPTEAVVSGERVTVTATNSGGSAEAGFRVTVEAADPADDDPLPRIEDGKWSVGAAELADEPWRMRFLVDGSVRVPDGNTLRIYAGAREGGIAADNHTTEIVPGAPRNSGSGYRLAAGSTVYARLYYRDIVSGRYEEASNLKNFVLRYGNPVVKPGSLPVPNASQIARAKGAPLLEYNPGGNDGGASTNAGRSGMNAAFVALAAFAGDTGADSRLLQQLRHTLEGNGARHEPSYYGGYMAQHEQIASCMLVLAKYTPRIWGQLSQTEKERADALILAGYVSAAWCCAAGNRYGDRGIDGAGNVGVNWNPNYGCAMAAGIFHAVAYLGGAQALHDAYRDYDHARHRSRLQSLGLLNTFDCWNKKTPSRQLSIPSDSEITNAMRPQSFRSRHGSGYTVNQWLAYLEERNGFMWRRNVFRNHPRSASIGGNGRLINDAQPPNLGALGMANELDGSDGGGIRTNLIYVADGGQVMLMSLLSLAAAGLLNPQGAVEQRIAQRTNIGMTDFKFRIDRGWRNYSSGRAYTPWIRGGSEVAKYYIEVRESAWFDSLKPWFGV